MPFQQFALRLLNVSQQDQVIDFYKAWKIYWDHEALFYGIGNDFSGAKQQDWEDFELFLTQIEANPENIVQSTIEISDLHLIHAIALAMKMRYPNEEDFYKECVDILVERYPHDFGILGDFYEVDLDPQNPDCNVISSENQNMIFIGTGSLKRTYKCS